MNNRQKFSIKMKLGQNHIKQGKEKINMMMFQLIKRINDKEAIAVQE